VPEIDAVIFDFSGVMVGSAFDAMTVVSPDHPVDELLELLLGPYHEDTDHPWHRVERGEISILDWVVWVQAEAETRGIPIDLSQMRHMMQALAPHERMVERCREIRGQGLKTALLTNNVREGSGTWREVLALDELFDVVVDSSEVGMRKPNVDIYHLTLEQLGGIAPERAVFLDDAPGNVEGARLAGLHAIHVVDIDEAIATLDALLLD
jgi:putative hydrolase of the HAD superfamily